ncbi:MAG: glycosyltransferase [Verrucomicrobiaceae bacterium]|jgi:N-acetylglucosaminyldiphosphoundecaprenol N-acetyl-beta-D-mannosaminyltransferase|nr:glycosyltransferase [Verrucomicrobiaceae bacterium]MBB07651.1 glycosyltransferase [Roseibacillus sp.]
MSRKDSSAVTRVNVLGVGISALNMRLAVEQALEGADRSDFSGYITVSGVHGVMESHRDIDLRRIHNRSFLSTPDGMPMVWMAKWSGHQQVERVYGPDLMLEVVRSTAGTGRKHFFWGGNEGVAEELAERMRERFPGTEVAGTCCPPFRPLSDPEQDELAERLKETRPHFFWVGLSTPKQERFMHDFLARNPELCRGWGHGLVMFGVGAAFDFHTGRVRQAPGLMQRCGLEWLFRLCCEPRRLWRRYAINNTAFLKAILPQLMGLKQYPLEK